VRENAFAFAIVRHKGGADAFTIDQGVSVALATGTFGIRPTP